MIKHLREIRQESATQRRTPKIKNKYEIRILNFHLYEMRSIFRGITIQLELNTHWQLSPNSIKYENAQR